MNTEPVPVDPTLFKAYDVRGIAGEILTDEVDYPAGVMITASHNPGQYNGMKFCRAKAFPISLDSGLDAIRDLAVRGDFPTAVHTGQVRKHEIIDAYIKHVLSFIDVNKVKPLK